MGKFKDQHGHTRWKEARNDVKEFVKNHREEIGDVLETVLEVACPRIADIVEAIQKIKSSNATREEKKAAIYALKQLKSDIDEQD